MVHLSTRFVLFMLYLMTRASYLMGEKDLCCKGDITCSGCWMCPGSELLKCWNDAIEKADKCKKHNDLRKRADCYCKGYGKAAKCWSAGRCCTEYAPTLAAAANVCNLATYPKGALTSEKLDKVVGDAFWARNKIWHNDSGRDVPKLSIYIQPYSSSTNSDADYESYSKQPVSNSESYSKKPVSNSESYSKKPDAHSNESSYTTQSHSSHSEQFYTSKKNSNQDTQTYQDHHWQPQLESRTPELNTVTEDEQPTPKAKSHPDKSGAEAHKHKIHHQAKCSVAQHKCQKRIASQYHQARWSHTKKSLAKRAQNPLHSSATSPKHSAELWKRAVSHVENGQEKCGTDFQGVAYPTEVPETVSKIFASL